MTDSVLKTLKGALELLPALDAELAACERRCSSLRAQLRELEAAVAPLLTQSQSLPLESAAYAITVNGKRRLATADEVERTRRTWRGDLQLDIPGRSLRVRKGKKNVEVHLGDDQLHRGVERVLIQGMSHPGRSFGHRSIQSRSGADHSIGAPVLSRYVLTIRRVLGDSGRKPAYLLSDNNVDRFMSDTCRGYVFSDHWEYTVIERVNW